MKKCISVLVCIVMLIGVFTTAVSAADELINPVHYDLPLLNTIANVQAVAGSDAQAVLTDENAPGIALVNVSEVDDVAAFMQLCAENSVVPTFRAVDNKEVQKVISAVESESFKDVTVISADPAVLKYTRNKKAIIRTGLEITLEKEGLTSKEAHAIRTQVRSAPATFCVIDEAFASRQAVAELQELAVAVWVKAGDSDTSVIKAVTSGANGVITANAYHTATLLTQVLAENSMTRTPIMIGHRGNPTQAPENSLSGFLTAYENGADVFEIDVEITKDGEIVIMHDNTINRTTDYTGDLTVNNMTLEEIKTYRLKDKAGKLTDEAVPTFREVLEAFKEKDCRIFIEFKGYNQKNVPAALALVKEYEMEDRVDVISFNDKFLTQTQKEIEGMSTGYLQSPSGYTAIDEIALDVFYNTIIHTNGANSTINPNNSVISEPFLQVATDRGMTVWPWTYSKSTANKAFLLCPDGITTDDVQWSKDMLKFIEAETTVKASKGKPVALGVVGTTYGGVSADIAQEDYLISVLDGKGVVTVENGVVTATGNGTAHVLVGYKAATANGNEYVLYAQPITVTVGGLTPTVLALIIAAAILLVGAMVVVVLLKVKK